MKFKSTAIVSILSVCPIHAYAQGYGTEKPSPNKPAYDSKPDYKSEAVAPYQFGQMWRPDKGLMFMSGAYDKNTYVPANDFNGEDGKTIDNRRSLVKGDLDQFCMTLRLQQNFDYEDKIKGPAQFSWSHPASGSDSWDIDASLRADFWIPGFYDPKGAEMSLALGYDVQRSKTPTSEIDTQRIHLALPFVVKELPLIGAIADPLLKNADQVFQADFSYGFDGVSDDDGFDFETNYTPVFKLAEYGPWVGVPCSFKGKALSTSTIIQESYYSVEPKAGLSYGSKYTLGSPIASLNDELVASYSLAIKLGTQFGIMEETQMNRRINAELSLALKGGTSVNEGDTFNSQVISLEIKPAQESTVSLVFSYENGAKSFTGEDAELTSVSLGWGF